MPRSQFDELIALAEDNDGLITADQARADGFTDSVLARLVQRRRLVRIARGVYRIPYVAPGAFAQYREAVLWAKANRGPEPVAISHETALAVYRISDADPESIHLTVPKSTRLRRRLPKGLPYTTTISLPMLSCCRKVCRLRQSSEPSRTCSNPVAVSIF